MEKQTNIDILYQIAVDRLDAQLKRVDGIDAKIGMTFGLTNGITAALVAFITFIPHPVPQLVLIFAILTALAYLVTLILLFFAYRCSRWGFKPDVKTLKDICTDPKYHDYPEIVKQWVANQCISSFEWNSRLMTIKVRRAYRALGTVSAQGLFLVASCICYLLN